MRGDRKRFQKSLLRWFDAHKRDLPWRAILPGTGRPDPYHVLLSEFMLQQTQVVTVLPYFQRFLSDFPTIESLAKADEQQILRLWQGLGYYSRARNLLKAARFVVDRHTGKVPTSVDELMELPGVGRYTAGAIASIAHGVAAPILDGNVIRVICRLDAIRTDPREKHTLTQLWQRAEELVPGERPGDFNSAMMELGATVCIPRKPQCLICPVASHCVAREEGLQDQIPAPRVAKKTPHESRIVYCLRRKGQSRVEYAFEQRPDKGRWAGMWQFVTRAIPDDEIEVATRLTSVGSIDHTLTHRRYTFDVRHGTLVPGSSTLSKLKDLNWQTLEESDAIPLPRPHMKIRAMIHALER